MYFSWMKLIIIYITLVCLFFPDKGFTAGRKTSGEAISNLNRKSFETVETFYWGDDATGGDSYKIRDNPHYAINNRRSSGRSSYVKSEKKQRAVLKRKESPKRYKAGKQARGRSKFRNKSRIRFHKIKRGDTLYSLARLYGVKVADICKRNRIKNASKIKMGTTIIIPSQSGIKSVESKKVSTIRKPETKPSIKRTSARKVVKSKKPDKKPLRKTAVKSKTGRSSRKFFWPVDKVRRITKDGKDGVKILGINIRSSSRAAVKPASTGVVKKVGYMRGYGNYVVVKHNLGYITVYSNLDSIYVAEGQKVSHSDVIGRLDEMNCNLHFQVNKSGKIKDPLKVLPSRRRS